MTKTDREVVRKTSNQREKISKKLVSLVLRPILHMFFDGLQRLGKVLRELDLLPKFLWRVRTLDRLEVQVSDLL